eukprot:CAMPEP_0196666818 /NCGR_PEP_ID=MMETSP1086-20130531/64730_1 /TAXON_ID=77921 /ORGANISM="Cyanoptyche  gloeocystis , Strain SAG4.97" /LENGTH=421 /DNA_ID=CAMNT_0042004063 /DNA_START=8 /DNA_END=1273 /DNA_ORIENTATION=+
MAADVSSSLSSPRSSSSTYSSCGSENLWDFSEITIYTPTVSDRLHELINNPRSWDNYRDFSWPADVWTHTALESYIYLHWEEVSTHLHRYKAKLFALAVFEVAARGLVNLVTVEGLVRDRRVPIGICAEVNIEACILRPPKNKLLRSLLEHCENIAKLFALAVFEVAARGLVNLVTVEGLVRDRRVPIGICAEVNIEACILRPPKNKLLRSLLEHCENMKQKKVGHYDHELGRALATAVSNAGYVCLTELYESFDFENELKELLELPRSSFLRRTFRSMRRKDSKNRGRLPLEVDNKRQEIAKWAACLREEIAAYTSMIGDACGGMEADLHRVRIATVLYAAGPLVLLSKDRYISVKELDRFDALGCGQPQHLSPNLLERILADLRKHCGGQKSRYSMPEWSHGIGPFAKPSVAVQSDALT